MLHIEHNFYWNLLETNLTECVYLNLQLNEYRLQVESKRHMLVKTFDPSDCNTYYVWKRSVVISITGEECLISL